MTPAVLLLLQIGDASWMKKVRITTMIKIKGITLYTQTIFIIYYMNLCFLFNYVTCDICKPITCWLCRMLCIWSRLSTPCVLDRKNNRCSLLRNVFVYFVVTLLVSTVRPITSPPNTLNRKQSETAKKYYWCFVTQIIHIKYKM